MLFASLVDDPSEHLSEKDAHRERERLMQLVERLSAFEAYKDKNLLADVRNEIAKAVGDVSPIVVDPFCGGGSTLLEAQRLGLKTRASDLNPVPVLITTVLCRIPALFRDRTPVNPAHDDRLDQSCGIEGLKKDVRYYASRVRQLAWSELKNYYPPLAGGAVPFAYRWAWTVASPEPAARGFHTPLVSNWWLSRHQRTKAWIEPFRDDQTIRYRVRTEGEPLKPTTGRFGAVCLHSADTPIPLQYIREQGRAGQLRQQMFAIAARQGDKIYFVAADEQQQAAAAVAASSAAPSDLIGIEMPKAALGFRVQQYGIKNFLELFTKRQALVLETFARLVGSIRNEIVRDAVAAGLADDGVPLHASGTNALAYADAITAVLGICVGKMAQSNNILVRWFIDPRNGSGKATPAFDRHAVPMVWDFVETNPFGSSVGDWTGPVLETALRAFDLVVPDGTVTEVRQQDARQIAKDLPENALIATDPPYYANIGYADLSDFFYIWLRKALRPIFPDFLGTVATPKDDELIASPYRHSGDVERANEYFRSGFAKVFGTLAEKADKRFPLLIVYAIKQAEEEDKSVGSTGWEVFLGGLIDAGLAVVATWPVRTTTDTRMIGIGTNALASAIFVVGRQRSAEAPTVSRREFLAALKIELPQALKQLQHENIAPVDLAQAAIGPGMAVYTRYARVLDAEGSPVSVREALALINQTLDDALAEQEGDFDADSRWAITWFEQIGFAVGEYGMAEQLSKSKNTSVNGMVIAGLVASKGGKVRLLKPDELPTAWNPTTDLRLTAWEMVHHLIRILESGGESPAAALVSKLGSNAEVARELCYRLYTLCERKKRPAEALSYNALVQSWPEITRLAREVEPPEKQQTHMFGEE